MRTENAQLPRPKADSQPLRTRSRQSASTTGGRASPVDRELRESTRYQDQETILIGVRRMMVVRLLTRPTRSASSSCGNADCSPVTARPLFRRDLLRIFKDDHPRPRHQPREGALTCVYYPIGQFLQIPQPGGSIGAARDRRTGITLVPTLLRGNALPGRSAPAGSNHLAVMPYTTVETQSVGESGATRSVVTRF